jgi:hypothetical protein
MNTVELIQFSLGNAFGILAQVTADLTSEQADWTPPGIALPAGLLYWHTITSVDQILHGWAVGQQSLYERDEWDDRVLPDAAPDAERQLLDKMRGVHVDLPAMHQYAQAMAEAADTWLSTLSPKDLERTIETPLGEQNLAQLLETFVIWHINAHCGEISALKGCQGAKGYPF